MQQTVVGLHLIFSPLMSIEVSAKSSNHFCIILFAENGVSVLDRMSHLLFTALSATPSTRPSSEASRKAQEFELAARKMASVHPALVLRHLPMVASSLRGRSHYDYSVFRNRHLAYFQQILGILELCQPHLFHRQHADALLATLDCYMSIFKVGK